MDSGAVLMPGGLRLRSVHPLADSRGACELLYDLERGRVIEVPAEFRHHIAETLEGGNLDEPLLGWLASEDLLTHEELGEGGGDWGAPPPGGAANLANPSFDVYEPEDLGCLVFSGDQAHGFLSLSSADPLASLSCLLRRARWAPQAVVHLAAGDQGGPEVGLLRRLIAEAQQGAKRWGQEVRFELSASAADMTREIATVLEPHPFALRLRLDRHWELSRPERRRLWKVLRCLAEKVTIHSILEPGRRLAGLWTWARRAGVVRLYATKRGFREGVHPLRRDRELRDFREDLEVMARDMMESLSADPADETGCIRHPLVYEPMARVVRLLAANEAHGPSIGEGKGPCDRCWARQLCSRGVLGDRSLSAEERLGAGGARCDFWRAEVEAGIRLYHRILELDRDLVGALAGDSFEPLWGPQTAFLGTSNRQTC